jgi:aldehyde:ferredoxin oxidoreductase
MAFLRIEKLKRYLINSLVLCSMLPYSFAQLREVLSAATGWDTTEMEMFRVAERNYTLAQLINTRRGFTAAQDTLPERFFEVIHDGPLKGQQPIKKAEFERAKQDFYFLMGWDENGIPHPAKLAEMGIPAGAQ